MRFIVLLTTVFLLSVNALFAQSLDKKMIVTVKKVDGTVIQGTLVRIANADDKEFGFEAPFDVTMEQLAFKLYWKDVKKVTYTTQLIDFLKTDGRAIRSASAWGWIRFYIDDGKEIKSHEMRSMKFIAAGTIKENGLEDTDPTKNTTVDYKVICPHCGNTITVKGTAE